MDWYVGKRETLPSGGVSGTLNMLRVFVCFEALNDFLAVLRAAILSFILVCVVFLFLLTAFKVRNPPTISTGLVVSLKAQVETTFSGVLIVTRHRQPPTSSVGSEV